MQTTTSASAARFEFERQLSVIERVIGGLARHYGLTSQDAEDFSSWAKLRIIDGEYAMIEKFRGDSKFSTYIRTCIARLYREQQVAERGRWRPCAAAIRDGETGIRLETLIRRDGMTFDSAVEVLKSRGVKETPFELRAMLNCYPQRLPMRPDMTAEMPTDVASPDEADSDIIAEESHNEAERARTAVKDALRVLDEEDRVLVIMRYVEGMKISRIAQVLGKDQKPLYRRATRALEIMQSHLRGMGFGGGAGT